MTFTGGESRNSVEITNLAELYGLAALEWTTVRSRLLQGVTQAPGTGGPGRHTCWLTTTNRDGSPHVTGIGALWVDDAFWFETGERTRKGANLERDPRCASSVATPGVRPGGGGRSGQGHRTGDSCRDGSTLGR